jgi:hypothetical protein
MEGAAQEIDKETKMMEEDSVSFVFIKCVLHKSQNPFSKTKSIFLACLYLYLLFKIFKTTIF